MGGVIPGVYCPTKGCEGRGVAGDGLQLHTVQLCAVGRGLGEHWGGRMVMAWRVGRGRSDGEEMGRMNGRCNSGKDAAQ